MVAGLFRDAGYFMGDHLFSPKPSNPLGFFEDREVNATNERILAPHLPRPVRHNDMAYLSDAPTFGQAWLARLPTGHKIEADAEAARRIEALTGRRPFCFKDPRFSYTLHLWRGSAEPCRFVCVFRDPGDVIASILKECRTALYLYSHAISVVQATEVWYWSYRSILENHAREGEWFFLSYKDAFDQRCLERLSDFAGTEIDTSFPRPDLERSRDSFDFTENVTSLYDALKARAAACMR